MKGTTLMPDDDFFAPPPFNPETALATLRRSLRDLKLVEREGVYELKGKAVARARVEGAALRLEVVKRPSNTPEWEASEAADHAQARRFIEDLKRRMMRWDDSRGDE
jgi:hypothetical protein